MSTIIYTASRRIERTGYVKSGADISVAAADDSFNASVTVLTGLLTGNWVKVSGFANAINNGWFHVSANSTSTKILQDTTSSLVTEAAGPVVSLTGFKRGLGQVYTMEFGAEALDRSTDPQTEVNQPMANVKPEVILYRIEDYDDVRSAKIAEAGIGQWREMIASSIAGELITFDKYGTIAAPVNPLPAMIVPQSYQEMREGSSLFYHIAFKLRVFEPES